MQRTCKLSIIIQERTCRTSTYLLLLLLLLLLFITYLYQKLGELIEKVFKKTYVPRKEFSLIRNT